MSHPSFVKSVQEDLMRLNVGEHWVGTDHGNKLSSDNCDTQDAATILVTWTRPRALLFFSVGINRRQLHVNAKHDLLKRGLPELFP